MIDSSIPLGFQPIKLDLPRPDQNVNMLAQVLQLKNAQMQSQEIERGIRESNALNDAYKGAFGTDGTLDRNRLLSTLANQGLGSKIPGIQKSLLEADTAQATLNKTQTETKKAELEMGLKKAQHVASLFSLAQDPQSYGVVRTMVKQQFGQDLPEQYDPNFVAGQIAAGQTITERLAAQHQALTLAETQRHNTSTEANAAGQLAESRRHNTSMEGFRGQEIAQGKTQVITDPVRGPMVVNKGTAAAQQVTMGGTPVMGEVPAKQQLAAKKTLPILDEAEKLIDEATGSYTGAARDQVARVVGYTTDPAAAVAKLKVLEGQLMLAQPRMEGPQSDKDVMLYRQMAGQIGDPTVPAGIKKAALKTIRTLQERYAEGPSGGGAATGTGKVIDFGSLK